MEKPLVWTKIKPTEAGYYWHREQRRRQQEECNTLNIVNIKHTHLGLSFEIDSVPFAVETTRGEWAGPIPYPEEPANRQKILMKGRPATTRQPQDLVNNEPLPDPDRPKPIRALK